MLARVEALMLTKVAPTKFPSPCPGAYPRLSADGGKSGTPFDVAAAEP